MVAINQLDNLAAATADAAGTAETVPVDRTKLATADAIVLKSGDSKGSPVAVEAVALQTAPAGPTVTFMNGSETFATLAAADGKVVLPDVSTNAPTLTVNQYYKSGAFVDGVALTFYGWADGKGNDITADTAVTEDITVYAKYDTGHILGDVTGDDQIKTNDYSALKRYFTSSRTKNTYVDKSIFDGCDIKIGDVTKDSQIKTNDYSALKRFFTSSRTKNTYVQDKVYYVNISK